MKFSITKRLRSFIYAFNGIRLLIRSQHNAWIQTGVAVIAILLSFLFRITTIEWCLVLLCIGGVIGMEAVNTSIEKLADTLHPGKNAGIGQAKDLAAGAVLIVSITAIIIGLFIFVPHFLSLFRS